MSYRQEKAPLTQHTRTLRALTVAGAVVASIAVTVVTASAFKTMGRWFGKR